MYNITTKISNTSFKGVLKLENVKTDHTLFRLHYKLSVGIVLVAILLYSLIVYKVQSISCIFPPKTKLDEEFIRAACWVTPVYTLTDDPEEGDPVEVAPGVRGFKGPKESVRYHTYYQSLPFILLAQLLLFIGPRYLWYTLEDGKMKMMGDENGIKSCIVPEDKRRTNIKMLGEYFVACLNYNKVYGYGFAFCELLNLVAVFSQMYFLDVVTGYVFSDYGLRVLEFTMQVSGSRTDPMAKAFPVIGKCTFTVTGPSGNLVPHSGTCALPLNLTSERYFVFMWFYLVALAIMDILNVIYRLVTIVSKPFRLYLIDKAAYSTPKQQLRNMMQRCQYGDWFILYQLSKNLDGPVYFELLEEICNRMKDRKDD